MDKDDNRAQPVPAGTASDGPCPDHARRLVRTWASLGRQIVPLIGENGFGALFGRSLRLVVPVHGWLSVDPSRKTSATLLAGLEADLATVEAAAADVANEELMNTFTRQLRALIGAGLTARLLAESADGDEQQNQQEHN